MSARHGFEPGDDLRDLISIYADVDFLPIPVQKVDGVSLHLKAKGRRPSIIVNSQIAQTRAQFTLAHEFGHVLIPWHSGTIFSYSGTEQHTEDADIAYWEMEAEANRFASELLMPREWLRSKLVDSRDPALVLQLALELCGTSMAATTIALNNALPPGYVYARVDEQGFVINSLSSPGTFARPFAEGQKFEGSTLLRESSLRFNMEFKGSHNWLFYAPAEMPEVQEDSRPWRVIFDEIIEETGALKLQANIKHSVNAVISTCNDGKSSPEAFFSSVRQRMTGRTEVYDKILTHRLFNIFLKKKIEEFIYRR